MKIFKLKFLTAAIVAVCLCGAFTSCSDDDNGPGSASDLIGTWQSVSQIVWEIEEGDFWGSKEEVPYTEQQFIFKEDGTLDIYDKYDGWERDIQYRYSGGKIEVLFEDGWMGMAKVLVLDSETLVVEEHQVSSDFERYAKVTFHKVK